MSKKILMIDDDPAFIEAIKVVLEKEGYQVKSADSAHRGLQDVDKTKPDLILLDAMMEDLSAGFRFAKTLRDRAKQDGKQRIPILMITGVQKLTGLKFEERIDSDLMPVNGYMEKPVAPKELVKRVGEMIR